MKILITGAAGFIGFHLVRKLAEQAGIEIVGIDNINDYYEPELKYSRLAGCGITKETIGCAAPANSSIYPNYQFLKADIADYPLLDELFRIREFDIVINMAAQAGIRYSLENPQAYVHSNISGFTNILECCRHYHVKHLIYASSSSVYGNNSTVPFNEQDRVDSPASFYAATKKSNELMAYTYSHLFQLPVTGVRLFTVYGPWGRPDMAPMLFATSIYEKKAIKLFNHGDMSRDFTYIDDIVDGIIRLVNKAPSANSRQPFYEIYNIGNSAPVKLFDFIQCLEKNTGKKALIEMYPMQPGDVKTTYADVTKLKEKTGYNPSTSLDKGIKAFVDWFKSYYKH